MLTLQDIFEQLTYGELAQLSVGGADTGGIQVKDYPKVISHINMGLTALYTRFPLRIKELTLQQHEQITLYKLDYAFAQSNTESTEAIKYIIDTANAPFLDDVLRINTAFDELGNEVQINDEDSNTSIFTPDYDTIQIPYPINTSAYFFTYRARHPKIPLDTLDPASVNVDIPIYLLEALLTYVVGRVLTSKGGTDGLTESGTYLNKFEALCRQVEEHNLMNSSSSETNTKLDDNGWT